MIAFEPAADLSGSCAGPYRQAAPDGIEWEPTTKRENVHGPMEGRAVAEIADRAGGTRRTARGRSGAGPGGLSGEGGPPAGAIPAGRGRRYRRAHDQRRTVETLGPVDRGREPSRRRRHDRGRGRR